MNIGEICSRETIIIRKDSTVLEAAKLMALYNVGSLVVVETDGKGNKPIGIITNRDIVVKLVATELNDNQTSVEDIMTSKLLTAKESDRIFSTLKNMRNKVVGQTPVVDDEGYLTGILRLNDVIEFFNTQASQLIKILQDKKQ